MNRSRALVTTRSAVSAFCVAITAASLLAACGGSLPAAQPEAKQVTDMGGVTSASAVAPVAAIKPPTMADTVPREYAGIRNVVAYHDGYYSGSMPDGAEAFETLHAMGIKTIISVDGAAPDVEAAKRLGMRYIHLPISYNAFDKQRRLELTRATRDAMAEGTVYIHCQGVKLPRLASTLRLSLWLNEPGNQTQSLLH